MNKHCGKNKLHAIIMILCCAIPLVMLAVMYFTKTQALQSSSVWSLVIILICPLSHLLLMGLMMGKKQKRTEENNQDCH